jgi:glucose-6-phosphate 1-dehydrogenase
VTVEQRGRFYDKTGALRDMVPNHLFQILTLIAMEPPSDLTADGLRSEKSKVLDAVHLSPEQARRNVVRGQYGAGIIDNRKTKAPLRSLRVLAVITTEFGGAMSDTPVAIAEGSPTTPFWLAKTKPVAMPTRACSGSPFGESN